jgi:PAS domain S-box-containing protein
MQSGTMHRLLKRQLKRFFGDSFEAPEDWRGFIDMVNSAYHESDMDRNMLERSLELSSQELLQANSEMRAIFEAVPDIFFRIDASGEILDCKTGNTSDLLVSRQALIGNKIFDIPLTPVANKFRKAMEDVRRTSAAVSFEYSLMLHETENFCEARLIPLLEDQVIIIIRNVTDRMDAENALKKSEEQYRSIFENSVEGIFQITPEGEFMNVNPSLVRMFGYSSPEEMVKIISWADQDQFVAPHEFTRFKELIEKHEVLRGRETQVYRKDRKKIWISIYARMVRNEEGGIARYEGIIENITDRKHAEEALQRAHVELENRVAERTHELIVANTDLKELLQKQDVNIDLAKNILAMINNRPSRHNFIQNNVDLFFTVSYLPCYAEGGDHFFVKNFSERYPGIHKTAVSLKDQSGHEVSCILRSIITDLIHNALLVNTLDYSLEKTVTQLNREICELPFFGEDNFFTAINAEINHENLKMRYVSAGHPPFLFIRNQDIVCLPSLDSQGRNLPIGIHQNVDFMSGEIQLQKGDKLIFFTDGLTDMPHISGKSVLNAEDLRSIVASIVRDQPHLPVSILMAKLFNRINRQEGDGLVMSQSFEDDITLLGLELENGNHEYEDSVCPKNLNDLDLCVNDLFHKISAEWEEKGILSPETRLRMVLEEAMVNAWSHGNREDPQKMIVIRRRYGNDAVLEVIDEGEGFDFKTFYDPTRKENLLNPRGRGNFIMRLFTEETQWKDGGRHLISYFSREDKSIRASGSSSSFNLWQRFKRD